MCFRTRSITILGVLAGLAPALASGQPAPASVTLPPVTVTAQKEPADRQRVPLSVSAVSAEWIRGARITWLSDALAFTPNTVFTDFTARKLANPRMRGIGASPSNPAVTTYLDGVPILHANAASGELAGVEQVEFVRGPQSALFGRNTLGGVINVLSERPSLTAWSGELVAPLGSDGLRELRGSVGGPVSRTLAIGVAGGHAERDGFSVNQTTGRDVDRRSAQFAKAQVLFTPSARWETRLLVSGERARDGDYALNDLAAVRRQPFQVARDFEGATERDLFNVTLLNRLETNRVSLSFTTGVVRWDTSDQTDLDYSPLPLARRSNQEEARQFTQEVRAASPAGRALSLSDSVSLRWQAGVSIFTHDYDQLAVNQLAPFVLSPLISFAVAQTTPQAALDDTGVGAFGQGTFTLGDAFDLTLGARIDRESKDASLLTVFSPAIAPAARVDTASTFADVSPQVALAYRVQPDRMIYLSAARGYKAGGFNPASPPGSEAFGEEHSWNLEGGVKTAWMGGRVVTNAAIFSLDWSDLQLNVPNPAVPAQFYVANVGQATSRGGEVELIARPVTGVDLFATVGATRARFGSGTRSGGADVSGKRLPFTPRATFSVGTQVTREVAAAVDLYARAEWVTTGGFYYDEANTASQESYSLANFRGGLQAGRLLIEGWVRNAFDTRYVPVAIPFPGFTASGFLGEPGRPRTFGLSAGVRF